MNVGWSAPQIVNLDFQETGIRSRQQPLHKCRTVAIDYPAITTVRSLISLRFLNGRFL